MITVLQWLVDFATCHVRGHAWKWVNHNVYRYCLRCGAMQTDEEMRGKE